MSRNVSSSSVLIENPSVKFSSAPERPPLRHLGRPSLRRSASGTRRRARGEMPRVLLLVPSYTRVVEPPPERSSFRTLGLDTFEVMKRAGTPIGLLRIAAGARLAGFDVRIVDSPFAGWEQERRVVDLGGGSSLVRYGLDDTQLRALIEDFDPDIVGVQCIYTVQWGNARALADLVKDIDPAIVTVTGGSHPSGDWQYAVPDSPFDHVVINEADQTFTALLQALTEPDGDIDAVPGIAYRRTDGAVVRTTARSPWFDLHLAEIRKQGVTEVLIEDDHLLHDPLYAMSVCELLRKHDLPWVDDAERRNPNFRNILAAMRSGLTCRALIKAMADGGCYSVYLAVQSANEDSLVESGKPRLNAFQQATGEIVEMFTEYGIQVTGGFMPGFVNPPEQPGGEPYIESLEQIEKTIDYAVAHGPRHGLRQPVHRHAPAGHEDVGLPEGLRRTPLRQRLVPREGDHGHGQVERRGHRADAAGAAGAGQRPRQGDRNGPPGHLPGGRLSLSRFPGRGGGPCAASPPRPAWHLR
ncbi:cobalamin-dependent protein [Streptomyces sp. NPDC000877]|uniref:B12-binding domain-containing radical SAM protein n=1 Tax=unclassified Streptomyces TaxID=2593676 RepID=UPI0033319E3E